MVTKSTRKSTKWGVHLLPGSFDLENGPFWPSGPTGCIAKVLMKSMENFGKNNVEILDHKRDDLLYSFPVKSPPQRAARRFSFHLFSPPFALFPLRPAASTGKPPAKQWLPLSHPSFFSSHLFSEQTNNKQPRNISSATPTAGSSGPAPPSASFFFFFGEDGKTTTPAASTCNISNRQTSISSEQRQENDATPNVTTSAYLCPSLSFGQQQQNSGKVQSFEGSIEDGSQQIRLGIVMFE
ncbi:hypothetical protein KY289_005967 [Solanum tuberosum]|nr:hypothetical protein KY289_005967 [Solanum tuberosum]